MTGLKMTVKTFVDEYVRSEYMSAWHADNDNEGFGRRMDRFKRVQDAAEHGAYGATHAEIIQDWRDGLDNYLQQDRTSWCKEFPFRFRDAVLDHFASIEAWHEANGSLHEEIG